MKRGFTLIEMLVVISIIVILASALTVGYSAMTKSAQKARAQELVSNVATALNAIYQNDGRWPKSLIDANGANDYKLGPVPGATLARKGGMSSLSYKKNESTGKYTLSGLDALGVLDPWAIAAVKKDSAPSESTRVHSGGTVGDHIIRFAIDTEGLGFVKATVCDREITVRGTAIAWSCGPDGKFSELSQMGRSDDVFSFSKNQIVE